MDWLEKVERALGEAVERVFRASGQFTPLDLDRTLRQELERATRRVLGKTIAPNRARVLLHPGDQADHRTLLDEVREQVTRSVVRHADHRGWTMLGPFDVEFAEDADLNPGDYRFELRFQREEREAGSVPPHESPGRWVLAGRAGDGGVVRAELTGRPDWVLGRDPGCDLVIDDTRVSARHARIRRDGAGWRVEDLDSTNGIEVNGRRVASAVLAVGDRLKLGRTEWRLEAEEIPG